MKALSKRILAIAPSMTVAIDTKAKEMQAAGRDVVALGAGEPDFDTPDYVKEAAFASIREGKTKYTPPTGLPELKRAVCAKLKRENGLDYHPAQVVITSGAKHAIFNIISAVINPGDEVIIPAPYWVTYPELVKLAGGVPVFLPTSVETGYKITAEQLKAAVTEKTKLFILCNPSNPTGMVYGRTELEAFAKILVKNEIFVLSDEIYEHIQYGSKPVSIASIGHEIKELTLIVNGVSKAYAMTGWRVGYTVTPKPIADAIAALQSQATHHPANASQFASVAALDAGLDFVHTMVVEFTKRRDHIVAALQAIPGVICPLPEGAFYALPNVSSFYGKKTPQGQVIKGSLDLCAWLLETHLLAIVPGIAFGDDTCVRLSYATSMGEIERAIERLSKGLSELS